MLRSVSQPSLGTLDAITVTTNASEHIYHHRDSVKTIKLMISKYRGQRFWRGRISAITHTVVLAPWSLWWQTWILLTIIHKYIVSFLLAYYLKSSWMLLDGSMIISEIFFALDVCIHSLHMFWPLLRLHVRVYRRSYVCLVFDVLTLCPLSIIFKFQTGFEYLILLGKWLNIMRIYRIIPYFQKINETMCNSRKKLYVLEHFVIVCLILHGASCLWYKMQQPMDNIKRWGHIGYPSHLNVQKLQFNDYLSCWYYCACRFYNCIFGDTFPLQNLEKWLTSCLMILGYVFMRYRFIGVLTWELILENYRWYTFVDKYHHMINYLKFRGAPAWLVEQTDLYKQQLWQMKDGVLTTDHLQKLPLPMQMELIFDINVGHFHDSLLFRDIGEAFMRHISLLMKHELYLAGQPIWSQGVVKNGMMCVKRGVVELLSDEDDESPVIAFKTGTVLGEISLFYSIPAKVTVKAATYVELQVLRRTDFMRAMSENPLMLQHVREKVEARLKSSRARQESIKRYEINDSRLIRTLYRPMRELKNYLAGIEEEDAAFVDDSHLYYRDENNVRQRKFITDYLELYQLSRNVTNVDVPRICLRAKFPWILEPNTGFTYMFDIAHFIMVLYVCLMLPYLSTTYTETDWDRVLSTIVYTGLLLNIYIQLTTAIINKNDKKVTLKEIAEEKMSTVGFYLDILSVFPVNILKDTLDPMSEMVTTTISVVCPLLQVWHIWDYFEKWGNRFRGNVKFIYLTKYSILFVIFCYWSGCLLYIATCPSKLCRKNSWMTQLIYWETKVFVTNDAKHERPLTTAFAFGTSVFTGSGISDLWPGSKDLLLIILLFILGTYLSCFYVAKICSIYLLQTQRKLKFKESMRELFYFLSVNHVKEKIKARVNKFFCVQWYYNNAVSSGEIFKDMSANIRQEILGIEMLDTLLNCPLFQECSRDFLQTVAANTRSIILPDNETVQRAGDIGRDMYILQKGHCNILNHDGKVVSSLGPGSIFGCVEMLIGLPKVYTILTSTNCILVQVEYSALMQCWSMFPDISHPIIAALDNPDVQRLAAKYEEAKPLAARIEAKTNRITQEIKESFVVLNGRAEREQHIKAFDKLGVMRYIRCFFLPIAITPHGLFLKFWCALRSSLAIYYIVIVPYNIASQQQAHGESYQWADIVLYVDLIVMAYVAYYNEKSLLVTHPLLTVSRYLKHAFIWDLMSVFPFEELFKIINDHFDADLCRLNRILLVTRITGAFSYWESNIMSVNQAVVLLKFIPLVLTLVNVATAFVFVNCCLPFLDPTSSVVLVNCTRALVVSGHKFEVKRAISEYIHTFYWVFEIFIGCGCTPVLVSNTVDVWLTTVLQIIGLLYFAFMFGYIASTRTATSRALLDHNEKTRDLANFLYQANVDPMLTAKTLKYFEYVWKRTNGSNPQKICQGLNSALMEDTLVFMYEKALREVPLFGKVERSFIRVITQHLHEMYFLKGDFVVQCHDIQSNIYIIYRGKADVLNSYNEMISCMGPGGMFGNFTGHSISCSNVAIYASRNLDLLVLPCQTFFNLVKYYPKIQEPLNKAFQLSKDYILPITMDLNDDEESEDSNLDILSQDSAFDSRSGSSRFETTGGQLGPRGSHSDVSQAKSAASVLTYQGMRFVNFLKPGSRLFQAYGYVTCALATMNYVVVLYEMVTLNDCHAIFWLQAFLDIFFYIKIYMSMHKGFINRNGDLIISGAKCRRRYFKHKLWVWGDIIANLPLDLLGFCFPYPLKVMHYLRANKLFRLKYLWEFYHNTAAALTNNLTILQSAMTLFVVVLLTHTFTCMWLLTLIATSPVSIIRPLKMHLIDEDTPLRQWDYTMSFYVVVAELTTTGGDEFLVNDIISMVILAISLISGKMLAAVVVATSVQVAYSTKFALNCYEEATKELMDFLKNQGLSRYQLKKFWNYVQQLWVTERGRQLPALMEQTPYSLRCDLMSAMFGHHLRNCYIFTDVSESFLRQITAVMEYTIFFPGNYIAVAGDSDARMHWIASGIVSVVSVRADLTETTHELLKPGDVFGVLQGLNRGIPHCFSYRAQSKASILTLNLDSWFHILQFFPEAKTIIFNRSENLFAQI